MFKFNIVLVVGHHFDLGSLRSELQALYSDQDLQGDRGKLCDFMVFLKDMGVGPCKASALQTVFISGNNWSYIDAGVERSFSCLKRIKSYTRNTLDQGCLSSLALLAIERTLVKSVEKTTSWYD